MSGTGQFGRRKCKVNYNNYKYKGASVGTGGWDENLKSSQTRTALTPILMGAMLQLHHDPVKTLKMPQNDM